MEYAKDVIIELNKGQAIEKEKNTKIKESKANKVNKENKVLKTCYEKITKHKIMSTIITATAGFMILDIMW